MHVHLLNLETVGYTDVIKVCSLAFGNVFPFWKDRRKTVLRAIVCCGSLGEENMTSDWSTDGITLVWKDK